MTGTMTRNNHRPEPRVRGDICGPGRRRPRGCPRRLPGNGSIGPRPRPGSVSYTPRSLSSQMDWMVSGQRRPIRSMATTTRVSPLLPRCRNPVRFPSVQPISALTYPCHPPPPRADDGGLVEVSQMLARHTERQAAGRGRWLGITRAAGGRGSPSLPWEARPIPCQMMEYPQCRRP